MNHKPKHSLLKEPLVHFLAIAALLFLANAWFSVDEREVIEVDSATQEYLIEQAQMLQLEPLSEARKIEIIENFVNDEILVREARKRGFENSSRIRSLLLQNMRFFIASDIPEASEDELMAWFEESRERFQGPPTANYLHVFYIDPDSIPGTLLEDLQAGANHRQFGNTEPMSHVLIGLGERQIVSTFGPEQGKAILALNDNNWHGPFQSESGTHFLKLEKRNEPALPEWEQARNWVAQEWLAEQNRNLVERELSTLRGDYRIKIEPLNAAP